MNGANPDVVDRAQNPIAPTTATFVMPVPVEVEEGDDQIAYGWKTVKAAAALGIETVAIHAADETGARRVFHWLGLVAVLSGPVTVTVPVVKTPDYFVLTATAQDAAGNVTKATSSFTITLAACSTAAW